MIVDVFENEFEVEVGALQSRARLAAFFRVLRSFRASLLETDKRRRGLMILRHRLGRIMGDLREDELVQCSRRCRLCAYVYEIYTRVRTRSVIPLSISRVNICEAISLDSMEIGTC